MNKRGLSPVIATTLLIAIGLVLALIIFLWARTWIGETIQKDLGGGAEAIESFCDDLSFNAEVDSSGVVNVNNIGNVPIYGVEVRKIGGGAVQSAGSAFLGPGGNGLPTGQGGSGTLSEGGILSSNDVVVIMPILLGETDAHKKSYTCGEEFGIETTVIP